MKINNPNKLQIIKGINEGKEIYSCSDDLKTIHERFRGTYVDKFQISVVIESRKDLDILLKELSQIHYCLRK